MLVCVCVSLGSPLAIWLDLLCVCVSLCGPHYEYGWFLVQYHSDLYFITIIDLPVVEC